MTSANDTWPVPAHTSETTFFWVGLGQGELRIQACVDCQALRHPPAPSCSRCGSLNTSYIVSGGTGSLYTYAVHRRPAVPGPDTPFVTAVVDLDDGTRLLSNLVDVELEQVHIGMRLTLAITEVRPGLHLPLFRPAEASSPLSRPDELQPDASA
jgi:3-oxo-4,17-pregnadiene-20-carboxyl-CoA hydratase alpha subunit